MKKLWGGFKVAFSMYSKIPMPKTEWTQDTMAYAMCFFPLVGVVIGVAVYLWALLCWWWDFSWVMYAAGMVIIPIAISGGIHLDGFCDTVDALSSHQSRERKLEILKDPHIGAFGTMGCVLYILALFACYSEFGIRMSEMQMLAGNFILSRTLSAFSVVTFKSAKSDGTLAAFSSMAQKRTVQFSLLFYLVIWFLLMPRRGEYFIRIGMLEIGMVGIFTLLGALGTFIYYRHISYKKFGGITGDLAGFFLQICELVMIAIMCL